MSFKCGDKVILENFDRYEGTIVKVLPDTCEALVEFETANGGGCLQFAFEEMTLIPRKRIPTMEIFKSVHGTFHVVIQNCDIHVNDFLSLFDVWKSHGNYKYDGLESWERAKIWFECPMEFLEFVNSMIGKIALKRLGIEKLRVASNEIIL